MKMSLLMLLMFLSYLWAADTLYKKDGTTEEVKVIEVDGALIKYRKLSNLEGPLYSIKQRKLTSIQYENGTTESFVTNDTISKRIACSFSGMVGSFGLFNVEKDGKSEFTKGEYSAGIAPSIDYRISKHFAIGSECMLFWGKPKSDDTPRLIINSNIFTRIIFPMQPKLNLETIIAGGFSIWPESKDTVYIHPTLADQRGGWNIRGAFGIDYLLSESFSLIGTLGYSASSSVSDDSDGEEIWITHDFMLVSVGGRFCF